MIDEANSIFIEDDEGIMVLTDIAENKDVVYGEFVYDGKNVGIYNRNNDKYFALQNIPPSMRNNIAKSSEITIIEKSGVDDISAYSIRVRMVDDIGIPDTWEEYSEKLTQELQKLLTEEEFKQLFGK